MKVEIIKCLQDNYSYLIIDELTNEACVIDPSEANPIINYCEKNNVKPKYILNTHHHFDHVGGNQEIKDKYSSIILGYKGDKDRIPGIDLLLEDQQIWRAGNFETKINHMPGHTSGHISYHFMNEKIIFTGDTLFSLGCGKIFEGTYDEMYESLSKFKNLPLDTKIYCGHEYTLQNSKFCAEHDPSNQRLINKIIEIKKKIKSGNPTLPSTLKDELECNIFLRASDIKSFSKLRDLKDNF
jgi:hydroxyacylglutathione hydrolase